MTNVASGQLFDLRGQIAVVIGGARDLGQFMARALADAGADLVITSRTLLRAEQSAAELREIYGVEAIPASLNIANYDEIQELVRTTTERLGRIDVLVNNAGGGLGLVPTGFFERRPEHTAELIAVNLTGVIYACQAFARIMVEQGSGKIINVASIAGLIGRDRRMYHDTDMMEQPVDYAAAKAGVVGLTRDLAVLLAPYGICVNAISPGGFERGQPDGFVNAYSDCTPLGRMGRDEFDLQGAVQFLASRASNYVTGQNLVIDGGFSICK